MVTQGAVDATAELGADTVLQQEAAAHRIAGGTAQELAEAVVAAVLSKAVVTAGIPASSRA